EIKPAIYKIRMPQPKPGSKLSRKRSAGFSLFPLDPRPYSLKKTGGPDRLSDTDPPGPIHTSPASWETPENKFQREARKKNTPLPLEARCWMSGSILSLNQSAQYGATASRSLRTCFVSRAVLLISRKPSSL